MLACRHIQPYRYLYTAWCGRIFCPGQKKILPLHLYNAKLDGVRICLVEGSDRVVANLADLAAGHLGERWMNKNVCFSCACLNTY